MELTKKRIIIIIAAAALLIAAGQQFILYRSLSVKLKGALLERRDIETELFRARESLVSLKNISIDRSFVTEQDASLALDELTEEGKAEGVNFVSITPGEISEQGSFYKVSSIRMEMGASYQNLAVFLGKLDDLKKSLVRIKELKIVSDLANAKRLKAELVVNMYFKNAE